MNIVWLKNDKHKKNFQANFIFTSLILFYILSVSTAYCVDQNEQDVFTIKNIQVYSEAHTLEDAKNTALKMGSTQALNQLLKKIITYDEVNKTHSIIGRINAYDLVASTNVEEERMTSHSYKASVDYEFDPGKIRNLLNFSGIKYTGIPVQNALLVPILHNKDNKVVIWSNDVWRNAWEAIPHNTGLMEYSLTGGDLEDVENIDPEEVMLAPYKKYDQLLKDYNSQILIIVFATELDNKLDITLRFLSLTDDYFKYITIIRHNNENENNFYKRVGYEITNRIDSARKGEKVFDNDRYYSSVLSMKFDKPNQWLEVKKSLEKIKAITQIRLLSKSAKEAEIEIIYIIAPAILSREIAYNGYSLQKEGEKIYLVKK